MVQGIETDDKRYKHKRMDDEEWLCKDLNEYKKTVQNYIDEIRPDENKEHEPVKKSKKKTMTFDRILAIIMLGIFGSVALITGIVLIIKEVYFTGGFLTIFGAFFVLAFILYEISR